MAREVAVRGRKQYVEARRIHPGFHIGGRQAAITFQGRGWEVIQRNTVDVHGLYTETVHYRHPQRPIGRVITENYSGRAMRGHECLELVALIRDRGFIRKGGNDRPALVLE